MVSAELETLRAIQVSRAEIAPEAVEVAIEVADIESPPAAVVFF